MPTSRTANDDEPSLGGGATSEHSSQAQWSVRGDGPSWIVDAEYEHDGAEPDEADYESSAGFDTGEPSLGWTVDGFVGNGSSELELAVGPRPPQGRTELAQATVEVEVSYRRFLRGLTPGPEGEGDVVALHPVLRPTTLFHAQQTADDRRRAGLGLRVDLEYDL